MSQRPHRIDYEPGSAAREALELARHMLGDDMTVTALLDRLVITAVSALAHEHWCPPLLFGKNRQRWRLPASLREAIRKSEVR